jgi:hypothetical protein
MSVRRCSAIQGNTSTDCNALIRTDRGLEPNDCEAQTFGIADEDIRHRKQTYRPPWPVIVTALHFCV